MNLRARPFASLLFLLAIPLWFSTPARAAAGTLPLEISDADFWKMINSLSEPSGYFSSENFVSNENTFQRVIPALTATTRRDGVYIGVGPEQNFTYIAALRPRMAFIIDIRRQNMLQHLMYKAAFELSESRADFLSLLFSRERPDGLGPESTAAELFQAYENKTRTWDNERYRRNLQSIIENLSTRHHFTLTDKDKEAIEHISHAFLDAGTGLSYGYQVLGVGPTPTYAQLMAETDGLGQNWSYLASEESFRVLKEMERKNLVIPLVGDFGGPKTIIAVGRYLQEHAATVTAFYTSNVERYLFEEPPKWSVFYNSVAKLPLDSESTFIRAVLTPRQFTNARRAAIRTTTYLSTISEVLKAFREGRLRIYDQLNVFSR